MRASHRRFGNGFNPLPTNKAGRIADKQQFALNRGVSIHSQPIKPGECRYCMGRPIASYPCFNPLPTNKAGRINFSFFGRMTLSSFNPLPTNKAGRILRLMATPATILVSIHSQPIKPGECQWPEHPAIDWRFNPLPTNKAGRIYHRNCQRVDRNCFNPLPTNKAGRI